MKKAVFCLLAVLFFVNNAIAQKKSPIKVGWINEHVSKEESEAIEKYLSEKKDGDYVPLSFSQLKKSFLDNEQITHIWWLRDDTGPPSAEELQAGPLLINFVKAGGHLVLSMEAVRLLHGWGIEKNKVEIREDSVIDEGFGRPCGFHAFRSHPVFEGLHGGAFIWKGKKDHFVRKLGFFGNHTPDTAIAQVIGIGWTYITFHEDEKLLLEYQLGKGSIIAVGAYSYFSRPNVNQLKLHRFYDNIFNYTHRQQSDIKAEYWSFSKPRVAPLERSFKPLSITPATKWKLLRPALQLKRPKATDNFVSVIGRRMLVMGQEKGGIEEIWSHPFMSFRDIETGVQLNGSDTVIWLNKKVPVVTVSPEMLRRDYVLGKDTLHEMITVDFDKPVAVLHYEWEPGRMDKIWMRYTTNLRLMWPYSDTAAPVMRYKWSEALNAAVVTKPHSDYTSLMGFSLPPQSYRIGPYKDFKRTKNGVLGSPAVLREVSGIFSFDVSAEGGALNAYMLAGNYGVDHTVNLYRKVMAGLNRIYQRTSEYYKQLLQNQLVITSPDKDFNTGYQWALVRTDQFLQETPGVGLSMMAGFGTTSRGWDGRQKVSGRPGYAWYFGRDGEWSALALNAVGAFQKGKDVLDLFVKYQAINGKIFHELTSSGAAHYDAADATPLFVVLASHHLHYSGDTAYIRSIWPAVQKAMDYCYSTDTDGDHLIENTNVGHGWIEGGPLFGSHTEFYLAGVWAAALDAAAYMAGHLALPEKCQQYKRDARQVKAIIDRDFWSGQHKHFYNGKMKDGSYMPDETVLAAVPIYLDVVTDSSKARTTTLQFGRSEFSTDWGMRMVSENNPKFNPLAYHAGMVWPLFSGYASLAEYSSGQYTAGFTHLMDNLLDYRHWALGSVEETLNGAVFHPAGVCSQQCWSETMILLPAVEGMLGLRPDAMSHVLKLSPCFPWHWNEVNVSNIPFGNNQLQMHMNRSDNQYLYTFNKTGTNTLQLSFSPIVPLGTRVSQVLVNGKEVRFQIASQNEGIKILIDTLHLKNNLKIKVFYKGGIGILPLINDPLPGDHNTGAKIIDQQWKEHTYTIKVEGIPGKKYELELFSLRPVHSVENAGIHQTGDHHYNIDIQIPEGEGKYGVRIITINL